MHRRSGLGLGLIVVGWLLVALAFDRATPPLEASDEARHFGYVAVLGAGRGLPVADGRNPTLAMQEATQPPLYYLGASLLVRSLDISDAETYYTERPGSPVGRADLPGSRRLFLSPAGPASGDTLAAVRRLRLYSIALGLVTILATWATTRRLVPDRPYAACFAAALVAFNPMFAFIGASVNNDNLVTAIVAVTVWTWSRSDTGFTVRASAIAGMMAGLATLAKMSGAIVVPIGIYRIVASRGATRASSSVAAFGGGLIAVAIPWIARNLWLYGDPTAFRAHVALAGNARAAWQPLALLREWEGFVKSFWGVFGAFNIVYPEPVYLGFFALTGLGIAAIASIGLRGPASLRSDVRVRMLVLLVLSNVAAIGLWTSGLLGSQGRLLFPSIAAIATLCAVGLETWSARWHKPLQLGICLYLLVSSLWAAGWIIPAAYDDRGIGAKTEHVVAE